MIILGLESSCDETAAALLRCEPGQPVSVLASEIATQHELHAEYGGVVPEIASRAHAERFLPTIRRALTNADLSLREVDAIAVGHRPGLIGSLLVGVSMAKSLAWSLGIPLVGVDHVRAHLYAPMLTNPEITWPAIGLVVSGGHSSIYRMSTPSDLERIGSTIDDAVGEAFDKVAAMLSLGHPGGPLLEQLASKGDPDAFEFPISRLSPKSLDFSFSGLKTAVLYEIKGRPAPRPIPGKPPIERPEVSELTDQRRADIAASFQQAAGKAIVIKLKRALARHPETRTLLVGGGVAANAGIRSWLEQLAARAGVALKLSAPEYCGDNAAMIAGLGGAMLISDGRSAQGMSLTPMPTSAS